MTRKQALTDAPEERLWLYAPALRDGDTEYIRADIHAAVEAERHALREALVDAQRWLGVFMEEHEYGIYSNAAIILRQVNAALDAKPTKR